MNLKYWMVPLMMIVFIFLTLYIVLSVFFDKTDKNLIIKNYKQNQQFFEQIAIELLKNPKENIEISTIESDFPVVTYRYNEQNILEMQKENVEPYESIFMLMSKLNLKKVQKKEDNIIITPNLRINFGQYIVLMSNEKAFKNEYKILYYEHLKDNWFYIEIK